MPRTHEEAMTQVSDLRDVTTVGVGCTHNVARGKLLQDICRIVADPLRPSEQGYAEYLDMTHGRSHFGGDMEMLCQGYQTMGHYGPLDASRGSFEYGIPHARAGGPPAPALTPELEQMNPTITSLSLQLRSMQASFAPSFDETLPTAPRSVQFGGPGLAAEWAAQEEARMQADAAAREEWKRQVQEKFSKHHEEGPRAHEALRTAWTQQDRLYSPGDLQATGAGGYRSIATEMLQQLREEQAQHQRQEAEAQRAEEERRRLEKEANKTSDDIAMELIHKVQEEQARADASKSIRSNTSSVPPADQAASASTLQPPTAAPTMPQVPMPAVPAPHSPSRSTSLAPPAPAGFLADPDPSCTLEAPDVVVPPLQLPAEPPQAPFEADPEATVRSLKEKIIHDSQPPPPPPPPAPPVQQAAAPPGVPLERSFGGAWTPRAEATMGGAEAPPQSAYPRQYAELLARSSGRSAEPPHPLEHHHRQQMQLRADFSAQDEDYGGRYGMPRTIRDGSHEYQSHVHASYGMVSHAVQAEAEARQRQALFEPQAMSPMPPPQGRGLTPRSAVVTPRGEMPSPAVYARGEPLYTRGQPLYPGMASSLYPGDAQVAGLVAGGPTAGPEFSTPLGQPPDYEARYLQVQRHAPMTAHRQNQAYGVSM